MGGFRWSLQHLTEGSCDEHSKAPFGSVWAATAAGLASEDAAGEAGVSPTVGTRWFQKAGGMPPLLFGLSARPLSGRYLSFAEREEIALLRVQGYSMQEVARRLGRAASTIRRALM